MFVIRPQPGVKLGKSPEEAHREIVEALAGMGYVVEMWPDAVWFPSGWVDVLPRP